MLKQLQNGWQVQSYLLRHRDQHSQPKGRAYVHLRESDRVQSRRRFANLQQLEHREKLWNH